jgi:hypothetical protein
MKVAIDLETLKVTNNSIDELKKLPYRYGLYLEIESKIRQVFNQIILRKEKNSDLLLICYKIFLPLSNFIYWKVFEREAKDSGIDFLFNSSKNDYSRFFDSNNFVQTIKADKRRNLRKIKTRIKNLIRNIQSLNILYFNRPVLIHDSVSTEVAKALFPKNRRIYFSYNYLGIFKDEIKIDDKLIINLENELFIEFIKIANSYNISPSKNDIDLLKNLISPRLKLGLVSLLRIAGKNLSKYRALLIDTPRSEINKAIAIEFKRQGIPVYEFLHGHQHILDWDYYSWAEFPFITHLLTKSNNLLDLKYLMSKYPTILYSDPEILSNTEVLPPLPTINQSVTRKYLLIGAPYKNFGSLSQASSMPEIQQYLIEKKIYEYFTKCDIDVYYKAHPEGNYKGNLNHFWGSRIVNGIFEDIFKDYDGFLFYYTRSSVFPIALRTIKPIYIVDTGIEVYAPNTDIYLKQRCKFLKYDEII